MAEWARALCMLLHRPVTPLAVVCSGQHVSADQWERQGWSLSWVEVYLPSSSYFLKLICNKHFSERYLLSIQLSNGPLKFLNWISSVAFSLFLT